MAFSFNDLNLGSYDVGGAGQTLKPGRYHCEVTEVKLRDTRSGGKQVEVTLQDKKDGLQIRHWINVHVPSSEKATRIGREQLKALLTFGGHPTPDNPSDIASLRGLTPGVSVGEDTYEKDGETRTGSKVKGYFDPTEIGGAPSSQPPKNAGSSPPSDGVEDDDIPF